MTTEIENSLAEEIRNSYEEAQKMALRVTVNARAAITEACKCGELLETARSQYRRMWAEWLLANVPQVTPEIANRYITGAKKIKQAGMDSINNRQLLLFFATVDAEEEKLEHVSRDPDGTKWFACFGKAIEAFAKQIEFRPASEWTVAERVAFKRRAEPIVELYNQL
jgi:hypothetical protein